jgi:hypothetical protein
MVAALSGLDKMKKMTNAMTTAVMPVFRFTPHSKSSPGPSCTHCLPQDEGFSGRDAPG